MEVLEMRRPYHHMESSRPVDEIYTMVDQEQLANQLALSCWAPCPVVRHTEHTARW